MASSKSLSEIIKVNSEFSSAINLYLSLNKKDKIEKYIPTKSSVKILLDFLRALEERKEQASLLIGPYGKGKSHLILVLLAIVSLERNEKNTKLIEELKEKLSNIEEIGEITCSYIDDVWKKGRFLPVIINYSQNKLEQSFLNGLSDALKRESLEDLIPDSYYTSAIEAIEKWEKEYPLTSKNFKGLLKDKNINIKEFKQKLAKYDKECLDYFMEIYPQLTSGSVFSPLSNSDALALYKSTCEKLVHDYGFRGIYIVFDEFSKFIESQNNSSISGNMKLLQDICELSAEIKNAEMHITIITHKSIKEYGEYLSQEIINSFMGIEGRITEKFFVSSSKNNYELIQNAINKPKGFEKKLSGSDKEKYFGDISKKQYYELPFFKSLFKEKDFNSIVLKGCYPLNPISAYLLLAISEKVAQNERTLFTFVSKDESNSMIRYIKKHEDEWIVGADVVYDYFSSIFKRDAMNAYIHNEWLNADYALKKADTEEEKKIIKALALINIINKEDELPAEENTIKLATNIENASDILTELRKRDLLYRKESTGCYRFKTRAGVELKKTLTNIFKTSKDINVSMIFKQVLGINYILPYKYNLDQKMTRYFSFEFMNVEELLSIKDAKVLFDASDYSDGKVISLYSLDKGDLTAEIEEWVKKNAPGNIVIEYTKKSVSSIKQIKQYNAIQTLKKDSDFLLNNEIQSSELSILEEDVSEHISQMLRKMYSKRNSVVFYKKGRKVYTNKDYDLSDIVDTVLRSIYTKTPIINNELVNKNFITSSATKKARNNIIKKILNDEITEKYYESNNQEATVFRAIYNVTGLWTGEKTDKHLSNVISLISSFVDGCCDQKVSMSEIISKLVKAPIGMRKGVIPFYLAFVLAQRTEDIVVYFHSVEKVLDSDVLIDMCERPDEYWLFISKESAAKEDYIRNLQKLFWIDGERESKETRIADLLDTMQKWFRGLPQTTRLMEDYTDYSSAKKVKNYLNAFRKTIQEMDANPYEKLFIEIPKVFGTDSDYGRTFEYIKISKKCLDGYFDWLTKRVAKETMRIFGGKNKSDLVHTMKDWYDNQSEISKKGLFSSRITSLMSCIRDYNQYDDVELLKKMVKATMDVYLDKWNKQSYQEYTKTISQLKIEIERIKGDDSEGKNKLTFIGKNDNMIKTYYTKAEDDTAYLLKDILEGTMEDFEDMSVNDKVVVLLEIIEKII